MPFPLETRVYLDTRNPIGHFVAGRYAERFPHGIFGSICGWYHSGYGGLVYIRVRLPGVMYIVASADILEPEGC